MDDLITFLRARLDAKQGNAERTLAAEFPSVLDPSIALAEVQAVRRVIDEHQPVNDQHPSCNRCHSGWAAELNPAPYPCRTLRLLVLPYVDHPDFRPEWRLTHG